MKRYTVIAIMMLICIVYTACPAYAAPTQNLWGFLTDEGFDTSDERVRAQVYPVGLTKQALDVALTVEGLLYDGEHFVLGWRTENLHPETPALVLYTEVTVNGTPVQAVADHPVSNWWPQVFGLFAAGDPINNLMGRFRVEDAQAYGWQGEVEVVAHFVVKRPTKPMVVVDSEIHKAFESADMEQDRQAMIQAMLAYGVTIAEVNELDATAWQAKGYLVVNRYGEHALEDESSGRAAQSGADLPDAETQEVEISFHVDLDTLFPQ